MRRKTRRPTTLSKKSSKSREKLKSGIRWNTRGPVSKPNKARLHKAKVQTSQQMTRRKDKATSQSQPPLWEVGSKVSLAAEQEVATSLCLTLD